MWTAADLASELGTTERTVRRDVLRLRELGYSVDSDPGVGGGYRLGRGKRMPPLLLNDDEAIQLAVALRTALGSAAFSPIDAETDGSPAPASVVDPAVAALTKLEGLMTTRARAQVAALVSSSVSFTDTTPHADPDLLLDIGRAIRDTRCFEFDYTDSRGSTSHRQTEPHLLLSFGRTWYLQAFDRDREDWRTFRVDRITAWNSSTRSFPARTDKPPAAEALGGATPSRLWELVGTIRVEAPVEEVRTYLPGPYIEVVPEPGDADCALVTTSANSWRDMAAHFALLPWEFSAVHPPELRAELAALSEKLSRAASAPGSPFTC